MGSVAVSDGSCLSSWWTVTVHSSLATSFVLLCTSFSFGAPLVADCTQTSLVGHEDLEDVNQMNMMRSRVMSAEHRGDIQAALCCFYFELMRFSSMQQDCIAFV